MNKLNIFLLVTLLTTIAHAKVVKYELVVKQERVNMSGKKDVDFALTVNGGIPGPVLEFTEGDEAEILVKNQIPGQELSIHWHGILLPVEMDGVPYVTTPPIYSGAEYMFKFKLRQHGTYWYHSHTNVQEQKGVYGAFIVHPAKNKKSVRHDVPVVISDWSDEDATQILKNLKKDGDYYMHKKNTIRSYSGAWKEGALTDHLSNEWMRMAGMDYSDVGYDAFLMNGKVESQVVDAKKGERVRLRFINAAASTYFYIRLADQGLRVVAADGIDIQPQLANEIFIGMAETYDIEFEIPDNRNYQILVSAQDGTGVATAWVGNPKGEKVFAPSRPQPNMYEKMDHGSHTGGHLHHSSANEPQEHSHHQHHEPTIESLTVNDLKATDSTAFTESKSIIDLKLVLDGDMERYVWHINNKAIHQDRNIEIQEGQVVRFTFVNNTMMHHPMHLHGHFFRVLNQYGEKSPLKHTVDVPPFETRVIEFLANEPGEWMLHCHNLYHLKTGMARVVKYLSYKPKPEILPFQNLDPHLHDHWYHYGQLSGSCNLAHLYLRTSQTWNQFDLKIESRRDEKWKLEGDLFYRRWYNQFLNLGVGATHFHDEQRAAVSASYLLPLLVESQVMFDSKSKFRLDLEKKFQWTQHWYSHLGMVWRQDENTELDMNIMYSRNWALSYGVTLTAKSVGAGFNYQF